MAKRSRKRPQLYKETIASSEPDVHPEATLDPEASLDRTLAGLQSTESTNAPEIGKADEEDLKFAAGGAQLLDKFLHGRIPMRARTVLFLLSLGWFGFISWLFLQDNEAGKLDAVSGMKWFWVKAGIYSAFSTVVAVVVGLLGRFVPAK